MTMRNLRTGAALLATAAVLAACGDDPTEDGGAGDPVPSTESSAADELTESEWNSFKDVGEERLPDTDGKVVWSGTVSSGSSYELDDAIEPGEYTLDLVCVGTGESYIEFTLGDTGVTTSLPCAMAGAVTSHRLEPGEKGTLKISGGSGSGIGGGGYGTNVLVGRLVGD
ncbi:hypothetical protein AB0I28_28775 [Phytomonospora sp. NPDC050363]|uniref:hypothetical protein n=1 Tax=Phytomonospora sp. NPDC050363 TaxID=3155642 RepID=UPI0033D3D75E